MGQVLSEVTGKGDADSFTRTGGLDGPETARGIGVPSLTEEAEEELEVLCGLAGSAPEGDESLGSA